MLKLSVIEALIKAGKIPGQVIPKRSKNRVKIPKPKSHQWQWIYKNLWHWCKILDFELHTEFLFHMERDWALDFAVPEIKLAIEYEGVFSETSRHTHLTGYLGDIEKYNAAAVQGWMLIRLTANNYESLHRLLEQIKITPHESSNTSPAVGIDGRDKKSSR